jgi:uncharacterized Ntn-hydrolase superfamily protein
MTWSIVARDAVGALCPHAEGGAGALATQVFINPTYGPRGLRLLREGAAAETVVDSLIGADEGRAHRQSHVQDAVGALRRTSARSACRGPAMRSTTAFRSRATCSPMRK